MLFPLALLLAASQVQCDVKLSPRAMSVHFHFPASQVNSPTLKLDDWADAKNLPYYIYFFQASDETARPLVVTKPTYREWKIQSGGKPFDIDYTVICQKQSHMGDGQFSRFDPTLLPDYVFVWGHSWAMMPEDKPLHNLEVRAAFDPGEYKNGELSCGASTNFDGLQDRSS